MKKRIRIGTRSSKLAVWQAEWIRDGILGKYPEIEVELVLIKTKGDKILDVPLAKIGGKGLFVKELEVALLEEEVDLAVHSMKDVPVELPETLEISVITKREDPRDAFVSNRFQKLDDLPQGSVVGTSSLRRIAQLKKYRQDLVFKDLRGNVNTRLKKLDDGEFDAIILAAAGLIRLGFHDRIAQYVPENISLPSAAQGIIGIETRKNDFETTSALDHLQDQETKIRLDVERSFLTRLNGGCQVPIAGFSQLDEQNRIQFECLVADTEGVRIYRESGSAPVEEAKELGEKMAVSLLEQGADKLLKELGIHLN